MVYFWTDFKGAFRTVFIQSPTYMKAQAYLQNIHSLYIENKTTNKNNHLFYSSKKKKLKVKCIFLFFFFFFQITRHIIYSTLCILAFPLSIHLDLISVKIKVYRHFSPLELTQHSLWGRGTHAHQVWPGQTTYSWLTAAGWETNSHNHSVIRTVEPTWLPLEKCKGQTLTCGSAQKFKLIQKNFLVEWKHLNSKDSKDNNLRNCSHQFQS